jgi:hypothetical protein
MKWYGNANGGGYVWVVQGASLKPNEHAKARVIQPVEVLLTKSERARAKKERQARRMR